MKANEVLERYKSGERDFRRLNLRSQSFQGANLAGADFSECDLRGTNFTNAILNNTKFCGVQAGLPRRFAILLVLATWIVSGIAGMLSIFASDFVTLIFNPNNVYADAIRGIISFIVLIVFLVVTIQQGLIAGAGIGTVAIAIAVAGAGAITVVGGGASAGSVAGSVAGAGAVALAIVVTVAIAVAIAIAIAGMEAGMVALAIAVIIAGFGSGAGVGIITLARARSVAIVLLSGYIGWRALTKNQQDPWVRSFAIAFAATGGTSFRGADLSDADFTNAKLKSTDFRYANLTRTCFRQTKLLDRVRPGKSYLQNFQILPLLVTGQGQDQNFDRLKLGGINLQGANLVDASFIGSDLSDSNLQDADLSRAKLKQTQLDGTDFTGATLTGAYIEDWGITRETKFDGVRCEYVYMRVPTKKYPDPLRKPDNHQEVFEDGGFGDFIQPIFNTLDLYHNQGVDPRAIAISIKQLAENNPEAEIEIVAMEKRGQDKFLLRAKTVEGVDKSKLSQAYFEDYNQLKGLPSHDVQLLIAEKDARIASLENMVSTAMTTAISKPSIQAHNYHNQGDTMSDHQGSINIGNVSGGSISGLAAAGENQNITGSALGDISGTVTNTIGQLEKADDPESPKLADLLKQLQAAIENDPDIKPEVKIEALEQVKALAEAGKNPKEGGMQKAAKTAMTMLKGIIADLPTITKVVTLGQTLLPAIAHLFGL